MRLNPVFDELGDYPIATIQARARDRRDAGLPVVDFSIGDPREPTPPFIIRALEDAIPEISQYPTAGGLAPFRSAVADYVDRRFGVGVDPDSQVLPTSGAKEAIFSTPLAFIDGTAADVVVYPTPGYPIYERGARFAGADVLPVRLTGDFVLRADSISNEAWSRARMVWTNSPHNPTGAVSSLSDLADLYERARDEDVLLLSDECYADVYEEAFYPEGPASVLQVAGEGSPGVIVYLSLSKRSGMTGYRSGAMVGDAEAIAALRVLRSTTGTASQEFVQSAAVAAWGDDAHAAERRTIFTEKRRILRAAFDDLGLDVVGSAAGLYLWVAVDDDLAVSDRLLDEGVVVSPGRFFGRGGEGFLRLALVPALDECEAAADTLRSVLG
ncbi:MAG: succinyldiaminopimelate transaminase [Acidimicrobiia bacterium]|nr:MAG: succinyldiaminopimelate transaminase [Acidimicrobiia bacterium]